MKVGGRLSSKQMLLDIGVMRKYALKLLEENKPYSHLLKEILKYDYYYEEDMWLPSIKELAQRSGLQYGKVRDQILKIYTDLVLDYDSRLRLSFPKVSYVFYIREFWGNESFHVEADYIPVVPRVGEDIELPFFKAHLNIAHFYVEQVQHDFDQDSQTIYIWLKPGLKAWDLLKD